MRDFAILLLRATVGGFLAGHGAQKLFGAFDGDGLDDTGRHMESLGLKPGRRWALVAGLMTGGAPPAHLTAAGIDVNRYSPARFR